MQGFKISFWLYFKQVLLLLNEIRQWVFMEETGDTQEGKLNKHKPQIFRNDAFTCARNNFIANGLKQGIVFICGLKILIFPLHMQNIIDQMSFFSFLYLKVRITTV